MEDEDENLHKAAENFVETEIKIRALYRSKFCVINVIYVTW